ncbi:cytochrome P450 monooxygenase 80 [Heterobasidion irregulare TC 32-1]|uniref:Cytochrome P450 monooxygenase 80 n=1 Tax=Heterobasidion irregulare (strain TC 32-1) TaxID=747525 RepID=W4JUD7_HETIT|nr:cytochrome P450 monooxygenase 80 [Heterobasidion irregulare TC 32-1]ETW77079.1 cytochrome P450 monooxygenase 80 [Heterobasidion irregulare TC 32-1]
MGNIKDIFDAEDGHVHEQWRKEYGDVFKYKGIFNVDRLVMIDCKAAGHILSHSQIYEKPEQIRYSLGQVLGPGDAVARSPSHTTPHPGETHKRQLQDIWTAEIMKAHDDDGKEGKAKVDVNAWLNKVTLDIIGLAGFNYAFHALNPEDTPNELHTSIRKMLQNPQGFRSPLPILKALFPPLRLIPSERDRTVRAARQTMERVGQQLLAEKKAAKGATSAAVEKKNIQGRDLMSLLVKANMATDLPEGYRMDDEEVLAQVPTFLVAGHETTSTAVTWILFFLSTNPGVQAKLRRELVSVSTALPGMDELQVLPYLDAVVRETLRVYSPVPSVIRVASRDDVIPMDRTWVDRRGAKRSEMRVSKGDMVDVPILAINRSEEIWGKDAHEFRPERWDSPPEAANAIPGIWGSNLAFSGGSRACIGYRFSVIEMKALVFVLVRAFQFEMAVPVEDVKVKAAAIRRPFLASEREKGSQLPLWISAIKE